MAINQADIDGFLCQEKLAVAGVSANTRKWGRIIYGELAARGYRVFAVNPGLKEVDGAPCYPDLKSLPEKVGGVVLVVPPGQAEKLVKEAAQAGIRRVWMQPGAESEAAVAFCRENGISAIHGTCIRMVPGLKPLPTTPSA